MGVDIFKICLDCIIMELTTYAAKSSQLDNLFDLELRYFSFLQQI